MAQPQVQTVTQQAAPPPQPSQQAGANTALIAAVAAILAVSLLPSLSFPAFAPLFVGHTRGRERRRNQLALRSVLEVLDYFPEPKVEAIGSAQQYVRQMNLLRRAAYMVAATKRLQTVVDTSFAEKGIPTGQALEEAIAKEKAYFAQHIAAGFQRMEAATLIDSLRERYGDILGWYATRDKATTAECLAADGRNFSVLTPPAIGWPGVVHVNCRCRPGPPHSGGRMLK